MKSLLGIGISVGVLAGLWTQVSFELALITWVAFVAWATFFAAGGGRQGFVKALAANLSGVAWAWVASKVLEQATFNGALALAVMVLAFVLCVQSALPLLSFIPGAFVGTAVFFGTSFDLIGTVLALAIGACLGWTSELLAAKIQAAVDPPGSPSRPSTSPGVA